jgi:hypothetical protein
MKKSIVKIFTLLILVLTSCDNEDNYPAPNGGIYGTIYDAETNEPVPLPVQGPSGVIINLFEQNTSATKSIDFYAKHDGTYKNSQVFNGEYKVVVNGPFVQIPEKTVFIKGQTEANFTVIPYSRIDASAVVSGQVVTVTYKVSPSNPDFNVGEVYGYWNFAPGIDNSTNNYAGKIIVKNTAGTIVFDLENDEMFRSNFYKIKNNGNRLYFRIGAKSQGVINYSKTIEVTL